MMMTEKPDRYTEKLMVMPTRELVHLIRHLQWKNRLMARQLGKQGDTIYTLRCQLSELRELVTKNARGEFRALERANENLLAENTALAEENGELREKVDQLETVLS